MMQLRNRRIDTASGVAQDKVTRSCDLGRGSCVKNMLQSPVEIGEASGADLRRAATRNHQPAQSVSSAAVHSCMQPTASLTTTTKAGKIRQRMNWTTEINTNVMRLYYTVTNMESDTAMYRQKLYTQFKNLYPQLDVTEQRVADQRRTIVTKNLLPATVLEQIKQQMLEALGNEQVAQERVAQESQQAQQEVEDERTTTSTSDETTMGTEETSELARLQSEFETAMAKFSGMDPANRHIIPKQSASAKLERIVATLNSKIIPNYIKDADFADIHTAIYCGAVAAVTINGSKTRPKRQGTYKKAELPPWERRLNKRIEDIRCKLARLTQYRQGRRSKKLNKHVKKILRSTAIHTKHEPQNKHVDEHIDTLKNSVSWQQGSADTKKATNESNRTYSSGMMRKCSTEISPNHKVQTTEPQAKKKWKTIGANYGQMKCNTMTKRRGSEKKKSNRMR